MKKTLLMFLIAGVLSPAHSTENITDLSQVIVGKHRSTDHKHRDQFRHPQQTLEFFGITNNMTVVEIWPGAEGWYTELLAPYLRDKGKLYTAHFSLDASDAFQKSSLENFVRKMQQQPQLYDKVIRTELLPPAHVEIAPKGSVDRVVTFRNVHNWMKNDQAAAVFNAIFKALKPGGILGVVEHRNSNLKPQDVTATSGYVSEDYVISLARNAGFEFLDKAEINANNNDSKDYTDGVWTLPPTLKLKDKDKKKYLAIGESDRMTIKFIKPQPTLTSLLTSTRQQ